ncbi:MAG: hypothetical protein H0V88_04420 [Pyrinomonadaceae bacterium]|nr:hypothetical protein [Pyrinomonadaceae bacterium]
MEVPLNGFNVKGKLKSTAAAFLLGIMLVSSVSAQQNYLADRNRQPAATNLTSAPLTETELRAMFRYVPIKHSDDVNVQFYLTTALALAAGFDRDAAESVGLYNQYVDDDPQTSPLKPFNFKARRNFHFTSERRRTKLWQAFLNNPNTANLAVFLHAKQDSYFHHGYNYVFGHMFKGVRPDQTWQPENAAKTERAAQITFEKLLEAALLLRTRERPLSYRDIEAQALQFLHAADDASRGIEFARLIERITALRGGQAGDLRVSLREIHQAIERYTYSPLDWQDNLAQLAVRNNK